MTNEETSKEGIRFAYNTTKVSLRTLLRGCKAGIKYFAEKRDKEGKGEQSVKQLVKQGQGATSLEVSGESMRQFKKIANKYGVDFAIVKDKNADPPKYTVFFKAKDTDAITAVLNEYAAKVVKKENSHLEKPSVLEKLKNLKEIVSKIPHKTRHRTKERVL